MRGKDRLRDRAHRLTIASPCTASWDDMEGDDKVRFCGECELNVYNLSAMTEGEGAQRRRRPP